LGWKGKVMAATLGAGMKHWASEKGINEKEVWSQVRFT